MKIHRDIEQLPVFNNTVITIGSFDGVHLGHQAILNQLVEEARKINGASIVISFFPHPKVFLGHSSDSIKLINTIEEKANRFELLGIDHLVLIPFNLEFASLTAQAYISDFLVKHFRPNTIIIGHDHKFGKNRLGDFELLQKSGQEYGFKVIEIPEHILSDVAISSTSIRNKISSGNIDEANKLLGYPYSFNGRVVHGNELGRMIGFPTANILIEDDFKLIPADGVYAVSVEIERLATFYGMMNIGNRPTVDGKARTIEVHIFNFNENIYNCNLKVHVIQQIRSEIKFNHLDELKEQLSNDKEKCMTIFNLSQS
jgi:riboflavin kinase/FMN adenylyltransferase